MEGARDRLLRRRAFTAGGVKIGREGRPSRSADKRIEVFRRHGAAGVGGIRKGVRLIQVTTRFDLPEDAFFERRVIVLVLEVDEMETASLPIEGLDRRDHAAPVADPREHPGAGDSNSLRCQGRHESALCGACCRLMRRLSELGDWGDALRSRPSILTIGPAIEEYLCQGWRA